MSSRILLLNGPPGVGKTTVAGLLANLSPGIVSIEGDRLAAFAPRDKARHLGCGSTYRAAAALTVSYLAMGARRVIVDYCFLHGQHVAHFRDALHREMDVDLVTLWAPLDVVERRERARASDPHAGRTPLVEKVAECWHLIEGHRDELGCFVDATFASPASLASEIEVLGVGGEKSSLTRLPPYGTRGGG